MSTRTIQEAPAALPGWLIAVVLGVSLLLFALLGWRAWTGASAAPGPDLPVHAGMYNLRQELQKGVGAPPAPPKRGHA